MAKLTASVVSLFKLKTRRKENCNRVITLQKTKAANFLALLVNDD